MKNAKELVIPEGEVRTIHDGNGRLLWGKMSYETKYIGDTSQRTYTGKNLFGGLTYAAKSYVASYTLTNNILTITPAYTDRNSGITFALGKPVPAGTYTLSSNNFISDSTQLRENASSMGGGANFNNYTEATRTTTATTPYVTFNWVATGSLEPFNIDLSSLQIEAGSTATSYEPYVGGIPSPNPDYPQDVQVVTGAQTITLSDGVNSHEYTVSLGSIELCKIDTYQDYIYKSGSDWYVHKETNSISLNGSESWSRNTYVSGADIYGFGMTQTLSDIALANTSPVGYVADNFTALDSGQWNSNLEGIVQLNTKRLLVDIRRSRLADSEPTTFSTWLGENNIHLYYAIETPTDTKITDSTLISQLDAIHQFLTRYGYNATVSGNLPMIIDKTNL